MRILKRILLALIVLTILMVSSTAAYIYYQQDELEQVVIKEINKRALQNNRIIDCLLQIHIAKEETKFGLSDIEATQVLAYAKHLKNVRIKGLMGMATNTRDESIVRNEFAGLKELFLKFQSVSKDLQIISMGMSNDYEIAIEQGSTMVRVGSAIFGQRN